MSQFANIKAILFDKDGTLLDFNRTWLGPYEAAARYITGQSGGTLTSHEVLASGGYRADTESWLPDSPLASGSNGQIFESWGELLGRRLTEGDMEALNACFTLRSHQYIAVSDNMRQALLDLQQYGYRLGIATMDDARHAHTMIDALGLDGLFDFVCGADSGFGVKPEPGMVLAFAETVGIPVTDIAMVGDSPRDLNMGINAGAGASIGVLTGAHDRAELGKFTNHVLEDVTVLGRYFRPD